MKRLLLVFAVLAGVALSSCSDGTSGDADASGTRDAGVDAESLSDVPEPEDTGQRELQLHVGPLVFDARVAGPEGGDLVLLLHGYPETSLAWRDQLPVLAEAGYFAVAPDQRGYSPGAQPPDVDDYRLELLVADVLGMADALGRERFHLVGHDWGALIGWAVAAEAPDRLLSLTALAVPHPDPYAAAQGDPATCQYEASAYVEFLTREGSEQILLANDAANLRSLFPGFPDEVVDEYVEVFASGDTLRAATDWYRANCRGRQLVSELIPLGAVSVDTLMVWGDGDAALCREPVEATGALVTGAYRLEILEGVDHWIPERVPDVVNPWLLEHLEGR